jgi:plastocyanin
MVRLARRTASLALLLGGLAACVSERPATGPEPPPGGGSTVAIENFAYVPPNLSVASGTSVTWTNRDDVSHTVSAEDGTTFESGALAKGGSFQFTAGAPGTYTYFCRIHPFMKATLTVTP